MPKGKGKNKPDKCKRRVEPKTSDDNDSVNDNGSIVSSISEITSVIEEGAGWSGTTDDVETITDQDFFEDKLIDAIEGASQKSAKGRASCLEHISKALKSRYLYDFVMDRHVTITDCIERCLKKGKGTEQGAAAVLASLLCIQLGASEESIAVFKELKQTLLAVASDNSVAYSARAKCYATLGMCAFIAGGSESIYEIIQVLEAAFGASFYKKSELELGKRNDDIPTLSSPEQTALYNSALSAWSLLITILECSRVYKLIDNVLYRLPEILKSPDVELRITTGETIAIFYEILREEDDSFEGNDFDGLCQSLKQLATDGHKYRAKKDRKQQRSSFRDVLKAVEDKEALNIHVRFGREVLELDKWCRKRQYDAFCQLLGSGMNLHLSENSLLRDIFELGDPLTPKDCINQKNSKLERHLVNSATFKARTIARSKMRDKRYAVI